MESGTSAGVKGVNEAGIRRICLFMRIGDPRLPEVLGLGDLITRNIALLLTARRYPDARIHLIAGTRLLKRCGELFLQHSYVHELMACPDPGDRSPLRWAAFLKDMRARRFDLCIVDGASPTVLPALLCGAPHRIGLARNALASRLLTCPIQLSNDEGASSPQADLLQYAAAYARALGMEAPTPRDLVPRFPFNPEPVPELASSGVVIALHAGGAAHWNRRWPLEHYRQLCILLTRQLGATLLLIGGVDEREQNESLAAQIRRECVGARVHDVSGASLNRTASLLAASDLFIGNDSSLMHLAAALGLRSIVLCGPCASWLWERIYFTAQVISRRRECQRLTEFSRQRHFMRESACRRHHCAYRFDQRHPTYPRCLAEISVAEVWSAARAALDVR